MEQWTTRRVTCLTAKGKILTVLVRLTFSVVGFGGLGAEP